MYGFRKIGVKRGAQRTCLPAGRHEGHDVAFFVASLCPLCSKNKEHKVHDVPKLLAYVTFYCDLCDYRACTAASAGRCGSKKGYNDYSLYPFISPLIDPVYFFIFSFCRSVISPMLLKRTRYFLLFCSNTSL
jgi:hypothetical protein